MSLRLLLTACALASLAACNGADTGPSFSAETAPLTAEIIGVTGDTIGSVTLREGPHGVLGEVMLETGAVAPGWHGLHVHQVGDCSDIGTFTNSGGHLGMIAGGHGLMNPVGPEAGDLPNLHAGQDGAAGMEFFTELFALSDLRDADGAALIIHENRDDHISQPIGGAGPRVGCAVLE